MSKEEKEQVSRDRGLTEAINKVLRKTLLCKAAREVAREYLTVARKLTRSGYGWIMELNQDGRLDIIVQNQPGWKVPEAVGAPGQRMRDKEFKGMWGQVLREGKAFIANDSISQPEWTGIPKGPQVIHSFLVVPLKRAGRSWGMNVLATRDSGYNGEDLRNMEVLSEAFVEAWDHKRTEISLQESENKYRTLVEHGNEAIAVAQDGVIKFFNARAVGITGRSPEELKNSPFIELVHPEDRELLAERYRMRLRGNPVPENYTFRFLVKDGQTRWAENRAVLISWEGKPATLSFISDITDRKRMEAELRQSHEALEMRVIERTAELERTNRILQGEILERLRKEQALRKLENQLRSVSARRLRAEEEERRKIAIEIHDRIGSSLTAVKLGIEVVLEDVERKRPVDPELLRSLILTSRNGIAECKKIMTDLRPAVLDQGGIVATMDWYCRRFHSFNPAIRIRKRINLQERDVPDSLKTAIFRILQEALNNVARHSQAPFVDLSFRKTKKFIRLTIKDDGRGFNVKGILSAKRHTGSLGLVSMKERAEMSGGIFHLEAARGRGTTIRIQWRTDQLTSG